jgi:hypothetical protein
LRLARLRIGLAGVALAVGAAVSCVDLGSLQVSENVADGGSPSWCEQHAADASFCEDFDRFGLSRFDTIEQTGGTTTLDTTNASSPPNALFASSSGPAEMHASAVHLSTAKVSSATLSSDVRLEQAAQSGTQQGQLVKLAFTSGASSYEVGVGITGGSRDRFVYTYDVSSKSYAVVANGSPWPLGQWVRVTLHVTLAANGTGSVDVDLDGVTLAAQAPIQPPFPGGTVAFAVGVPFAAGGHDGWKVRIDNVVYEE